VFAAIQTQFTWVIKPTLALLGRTFSVRFAGNFADTETEKLAILRRRQMRLISVPVLRDHAVLNTEHVEP